MTAKRLIIKAYENQIVNTFLIKIYITPYKLLKTRKYSLILLNANFLF